MGKDNLSGRRRECGEAAENLSVIEMIMIDSRLSHAGGESEARVKGGVVDKSSVRAEKRKRPGQDRFFQTDIFHQSGIEGGRWQRRRFFCEVGIYDRCLKRVLLPERFEEAGFFLGSFKEDPLDTAKSQKKNDTGEAGATSDIEEFSPRWRKEFIRNQAIGGDFPEIGEVCFT